MPRYVIEMLPDSALAKPNIPGQRYTYTLHDKPPKLNSFQDFLDWLTSNPNFIAMIIAALMALLSTGSQGPERNTPA